jgi:hypothetical protein
MCVCVSKVVSKNKSPHSCSMLVKKKEKNCVYPCLLLTGSRAWYCFSNIRQTRIKKTGGHFEMNLTFSKSAILKPTTTCFMCFPLRVNLIRNLLVPETERVPPQTLNYSLLDTGKLTEPVISQEYIPFRNISKINYARRCRCFQAPHHDFL